MSFNTGIVHISHLVWEVQEDGCLVNYIKKAVRFKDNVIWLDCVQFNEHRINSSTSIALAQEDKERKKSKMNISWSHLCKE